jgi:hypothetical protein
MPLKADAADYSLLTKAPPLVSAADQTSGQNFIATWLDMVSQTQAAQPHWVTHARRDRALLQRQPLDDFEAGIMSAVVHLARVDPARSMRRFYRLDVQPYLVRRVSPS